MAWLGNSFTQITGQISNFTKEVLTEGTEEVDDPATALIQAQKRILELENFAETQKKELERTQHKSQEVADKLESSELQITALSSEYRELLQKKEDELNRLKHSQQEWLDTSQKLGLGSFDGEITSLDANSPAVPTLHAGVVGDEHDLHDVISSQHRINQLQAEVQRLRAESQHWKQHAETTSSGQPAVDTSASSNSLGKLQLHIEELEAKLRHEVEQRQHERAALQDTHSEKLAATKKRHKDEMRKLQQEIEEIKYKSLETSERSDVKSEKVAHLEEINQKLTVDLEHMHAADRQKAQLLHETRQQLDIVVLEKEKLEKNMSTLQDEKTNLLDELDAFSEAQQKLKLQLSEMSEKAAQSPPDRQEKHLDESIGISPIKPRFDASTPMRGRQMKADAASSPHIEKHSPLVMPGAVTDGSESSSHSEELNDKVQVLQGQVENYEREIEHFEMVKSDWQVEKEALEDILLKLRRQLREKEDALNQAHAVKVTPENVPDSHESVASDLSSQKEEDYVAELERQRLCISQLEKQLADTTGSKQEILQSLETLKSELQDKNSELLTLASRITEKEDETSLLQAELESKTAQITDISLQLEKLEGCVSNQERDVEAEKEAKEERNMEAIVREKEEALHQLQEKDHTISELVEEKQALEQGLEELDSQNQAAMTQIISTRDKLLAENTQLRTDLDQLQTKLTDTENKLTETENRLSDENTPQASEETGFLKQENTSLLKEVEHLRSEKEAQDVRLTKMSKKFEQAGLSLNELHMEKQDLQSLVQKLQDEILSLQNQNRSTEAAMASLEGQLHEASRELNATRESLQGLVSQDEVDSKVGQIQLEANSQQASLKQQVQTLQDQLDSQQASISSLQAENSACREEMQALTSQKQQTEAQNSALKSQQEELKQRFASEQEHQQDVFNRSLTELNTQVDSLQTQRQQLEKELVQSEYKAQEQVKQYESYIQEVSQARQMDASSLQAQHEKLSRSLHEKQQTISQLEVKCEQLQTDLDDTKDMLQSTIDGQQQITDMLAEKEREISMLQGENSAFVEDSEEKTYTIKKHEAELSRLAEVEKQYKHFMDENKKLHHEIEHLKSHIKHLETKEETEKAESVTLSIMTELEEEIRTLNKTLQEKDVKLEEYRAQISEMKDNIVNSEESKAQIVELRSNVEKLETNNQELTQVRNLLEHTIQDLKTNEGLKVEELCRVQEQYEKSEEMLTKAKHMLDIDKLKLLENGVNEINGVNGETNGEVILTKQTDTKPKPDIPSNSSDSNISDVINEESTAGASSSELENLRKLIAQKDKIIMDIKDGNSSLVNLLEERSMTLHGDRTLLDLHSMQIEAHNLRLEKEQMMSVLNEKTRECSNLKSEVHRLMNVVSQEKAAISKLQSDNQELVKARAAPNEDMKQEAIKRLSQIIRSKDLEIEALSQKNETLLQVLQDSSKEGVQISSLLQERDNLGKQVAMFQADREQIVAALSQKHQESMAYHGEVQRLSGLVTTEGEKHEKLQQQYTKMVQQYEDKQQALIKAQNQLLNYKQKFKEADANYREILRRHKIASSESSLTDDNASDCPSDEIPLSMSTIDNTEEVENLRAVIQSHEEAFAEKDKVISERDAALREKDRILLEKDRMLSEKERIIAESNVKVHRVEQDMRTKDSEAISLKKQYDSLSYQLQTIQGDHAEVTRERDHLSDRCAALSQEIQMVREANNKLSLSINDKDFELNALKEKINHLTKMVQEQGMDEKGEMDRLMKETEAMQEQAQAVKRDRNQFASALQQQQQENQDLKHEIHRMEEKDHKLSGELQRLRHHLLDVEETYTREALQAEEREKNLRNRLAVAEERALSSSSAIESATLKAGQQMDALQQQLHSVAEQRDQAVLQLAAAQETASQYANSLANLQNVLEQFQHEREVQQAAEIEKYQRDLESCRQENMQLQDTASHLQSQLEETTEALEAAQRLSEQLDRKEEMICALREEVQIREQNLKQAEQEVKKMVVTSETKIERDMVKSLWLGYFHTPSNKRGEVLLVIGKVLGFSRDEMQQMTTDTSGSGGWFGIGGLLRRVAPSPPTTPTRKQAGNGSFSELFVKFLERESSPQPQLKFPAEEMAREEQEKQHHRSKTPTFNPFAVPVAQTLPAIGHPAPAPADHGDSHSQSHILMRPVTLPTFATVAASDDAPAPSGVGAPPSMGATGGGGSVSSSGRSTPSSAVLRDVLQQ